MTSRLRVIVVDDEPLAVERLGILLSRIEGVLLVGTAANGAEALALMEHCAPDLCLLDMAMPDMSGIDVARALRERASPSKVVFVTAFDSFAVAAFDVEAVDYLVKPVDPDRLARAVDRARRHVSMVEESAEPDLAEFWVSEQNGLRRMLASDVDLITAERDYMRLHVGRRSWLINDSLSRLEQRLDPAVFVRLHRGTIVNRRFVAAVRCSDGRWIATLANGAEQKIGRSYMANLRGMLGRG